MKNVNIRIILPLVFILAMVLKDGVLRYYGASDTMSAQTASLIGVMAVFAIINTVRAVRAGDM